ncbi:class I SAM-dependent methyltransferase [Pseudonocardia petroleophila]|uniref:Histone-lysine N-methyltransferase, H3 lysine-79 specific n=1 Tax=Pseudonocardia petroleophila TaxID=37331 RepID=A0A7G7MQE1_9PSEU|nr:methyltransferase domain-containing protein [Pseudonocardia petroleophila]QNG55002.1 methyltransferase domain-containing protein [Pseudonocardia petroleophila]
MLGQFLVSLAKPPYVAVRRAVTGVLFERRYGVTTAGARSREELGFSDEEYNRYLPAGLTSLRRILRRSEVGSDDVFVDFGSGMGRVVLQAALAYPFRRVVGVELSTELHEIASGNLERNRDRLRTRDVTLVHSDVRDFAIPDDLTVAFLYNPFGGEVFANVVHRLIESADRAPRTLRVIYGNPVEEEALLATGRFEQVRRLSGMRPTREWARSNAFVMYRLVPAPVHRDH